MRGNASMLVIALLLLAGCASTKGFPPQTSEETQKVPENMRIEISLAPGSFEVEEVEFHVDAAKIPSHILERAKELLPGCRVEDCEIEYHGDRKFFEVTSTVNGLEKEVMFTPEGKVYRWEVEVDMGSMPGSVLEAARSAVEGGGIQKAEQILDAEESLVEYHFKIEKWGVKYKAVVSTNGKLERLYRETLGEIEVPVK